MSWRNTDSIYESVGHLVDALKDNLPCRGFAWDEDSNKECYGCPLHYYDEFFEEDCCRIRDIYSAIEKIDAGEE